MKKSFLLCSFFHVDFLCVQIFCSLSACALLLCPGCFILQAICLQNLSLCVSVGPWPECDVFYLRVLWSACEVRPVAATTM